MKKGRAESKNPFTVELERAQILKADGIKQERKNLRNAVSSISSISQEICLGIMATSGEKGISALKSWVSELELARGQLFAVHEDTNESIDPATLSDVPVYIKYNSSDAGNAYMKKYKAGGFVGVIFQPKLNDDIFRQYGDLPLQIF